mmetsp:Transcript_102947/g.297616  ORF Transcript_102947/g.297616 Transcript_102947/m.297616 type:complete len:228 (-) Transcript_102947:4069-4752(-)
MGSRRRLGFAGGPFAWTALNSSSASSAKPPSASSKPRGTGEPGGLSPVAWSPPASPPKVAVATRPAPIWAEVELDGAAWRSSAAAAKTSPETTSSMPGTAATAAAIAAPISSAVLCRSLCATAGGAAMVASTMSEPAERSTVMSSGITASPACFVKASVTASRTASRSSGRAQSCSKSMFATLMAYDNGPSTASLKSCTTSFRASKAYFNRSSPSGAFAAAARILST